MSQRLKKELLKTIELVKQGVEVLERPMGIESRIDCLMQIQETLIFIGNRIEIVVSESNEIIHAIEVAAELVYQLSLVEEDVFSFEEYRNLLEIVEKIEKLIDCFLSDKLEVLFLPYKSSMWDSLESIYMSVICDENCEAYVVPIPYYSANESRTKMEKKYEGDFFADLSGFHNYEEYSVENRLPDVIFIHNPYDDINIVTMVEPRFFSRELIKYTEHLVYIPYKVCSGKVKDHYCQTPGVKNAWKVFVQSEKVREVYCKYNEENKIVAMGSPKIDAAVMLDKNRPEIPDEWKHVIDGRKVFILNTALRSLLNYAEYMLDILDELIEMLQKRDDMAIIWRPHPLTMETMYSMAPEIQAKYMERVNQFKCCSNGIYDTSASWKAALAHADAYIGDHSSMVTLAGVMNKPAYVVESPNLHIESRYNLMDPEQRMKVSNLKSNYIRSLYLGRLIKMDSFIEMILEGTDCCANTRLLEYSNIVTDCSGKVGEHIWDFIKNNI